MVLTWHVYIDGNSEYSRNFHHLPANQGISIMTIMATSFPQFDCHSSTDWLALRNKHEAFRLRWDQPRGRGWETCYHLAPGFWLRILDLEQACGSMPAQMPQGHLSLASMVEGEATLEFPQKGYFELTTGQLICNYQDNDTPFQDHCTKPGRYLMVALILAPEFLRDSPFAFSTDELSTLPPQNGNNRCLPLDTELSRCLKDIASPPVDQRRLPLYLQSKSYEFLCLLLSSSLQVPRSTRRAARDHRALEEARRRLLDDLSQPPRLAELSRSIGMSDSKLKQRFKEYYGHPLSVCLLQARMKEARRLLNDGHLAIARIAETLGYEHAANFTTAFKRECGLTPREYRKRLNH